MNAGITLSFIFFIILPPIIEKGNEYIQLEEFLQPGIYRRTYL